MEILYRQRRLAQHREEEFCIVVNVHTGMMMRKFGERRRMRGKENVHLAANQTVRLADEIGNKTASFVRGVIWKRVEVGMG